jgi:geranylgeranylglycerol-phosphate geranylgeranyltransferase
MKTQEQKAKEKMTAASAHARIWSPGFWKAYWTTMRPYLIFISGAAGLVGLAFIQEPSLFRLVAGFIPLFLSYGLGQALTDCFQMDTDALSSPYRPLIKGTIRRNEVSIISLVGLASGILILGLLNPVVLIFGTLAVFGLLLYTKFKRTWWGGPPWNSWIVALLPIMGRLIGKESQVGEIFHCGGSRSLPFLLSVLAVFFAYANFVVMGYLKDISADRRTGYRTFPVVFGWKKNIFYSDGLALSAAALTGTALCVSRQINIVGILVFALALIINLYAQVRIHQTIDENKAHGPITHVVRAFILYCGSIIITQKIHWAFFFFGFYLLFEFTLGSRPEERQV